MAVQMYRFCNMNSGHCQLGRSLERILEEANLSGELKLSNRKLKDFPKSATKYDLSDTVFADLSRNRFSELPEEITSFAFLETLILYHNTIRQISDAVKGLSSLTYLDLRSNQLSSLPREICFLPIRVLLIANNRLIALPEELGRMDKLTELDASCNLLTNLPPRMGDLKNLKSLSLRNNQLVYLPREITTLSLISLNLSSNRISSLPLEIRLMTTLVDLNLENNPLTSPPAGLCVRGLVHVFKFLEMQATKDDNKSKCSGLYDGYSTLRRTSRSANGTLENNSKTKKNIIDPVCLINDGLDKLLSQDSLNVSIRNNTTSLPKPSVFMNMQANGIHLSLKNQKTQQISINNIASNHNKYSVASVDQQHLHQQQQQQNVHNNSETSNINNVNNSTVIYDEAFVMDSNKLEDKNKNFGNIQTYKEYKEALKQQRNQEIANLYKTKGHKNLIDDSDNNITLNCNVTQINEQQQQLLTPPEKCDKIITSPEIKLSGIKNGPTTTATYFDEIQITNKKPVQKVIPSRNISSSTSSSITTFSSSVTSTISSTTITSSSYSSNINDNHNNLEIYKTNDDDQSNTTDMNDCYKYSKPKSPTKCNGVMVSTTINNTNNTIIMNNSNSGNNSMINSNLNANITKTGNNVKVQPFKSHYRNMNWDRDIPTGKLSFTMRREFDKQKEETELIAQLRSIIETRLKMNVPEDIASALTDGVILCHLANHVRPRSVASIHVPSPGVPKLTMARCRRNVDNFLEACRRIGIDEELICSCEDVVSSEETIDYNNDVDVINKLPNPSAVFKTISALINIIEDNKQHQQQHQQKKLICCAADVLEGKGAVQIAITVVELFRIQNSEMNITSKSPTRSTRISTMSLSPPSSSSSIA